MFGFWKHTLLEKQLIVPTLFVNKLIFNDFEKRPLWKKLLFFCHLISLLFLEILHTAYLFSKQFDIIEFATIEETITSTMEALLRLFALLIYRKQYMRMLDVMQTRFWPTQAFGPKEETVNTKFSKTVNMFSHINTGSAFATMFVLLCLPFYRGVKEFPFKIWLPGVRLHETPLFEIITVWQWITNYWTVLFSIMCYDYIFVMFSAAAIAQLKMLQKALRVLTKKNRNEIISFLESCSTANIAEMKTHEDRCLALLTVCIEHHVLLTSFLNDIYSTYSLPFLAQFAGTFNALCFSGYILVSVEIDDIITVLHIVTYIFVHMVEIFVLIKTAQEIHLQYLAVADAAFDCDWYKFACPKLRRHLVLVMNQAQKPREFVAGGFVTCNLAGLFNIVKWSFSVITLLQNFDNKAVQ